MTRTFLCCALLLSTLAAAQAPASRKEIASVGFSFVDLPEDKGDFFVAEFDTALRKRGFQVLSKRDVTTMLGIEQQKQLLGCSDEESSCLAEISNALGVSTVVSGQLAKIGRTYALNLRVLDAQTVKVLASYNARASSEEALLDEMATAANSLATQLGTGEAGPSALVVESRPSTLRDRTWIPAVTGGVLLLAGGASYALALGKADDQRQANELSEAERHRATGESLQTTAFVLGGGALIGAVVATGFYVFGAADDDRVTPSASISPMGAHVGLLGRF